MIRATYRIQFHKDFPFEQASALAGYLESLGISHLYASPILEARAGSRHGYDVINYAAINPELGGESAFRAMAAELRSHGIGILLDTVPNHMAVGHRDNAWWLDLLENGEASRYASFFDIDWHSPGLEGRILAPFLDGSPEKCLAEGTLKLDRVGGKVGFAYFDHFFPLRPADQAALSAQNFSETTGLEALLRRQNFVLADWREADSRINWRRFFDITELAALDMENDDVFEAVHAKTFALYQDGLIDGLRIDHVDGLADPRAYCRKLRARLADLESRRPESAATGRAYLIVEKILASDETLPDDWNVDGTTGYDFMEDVSALLHAPDPADLLSQTWARISGRSRDFEPEELEARIEILANNFRAQREAAVRAMVASAASPDSPPSFGETETALSAVVAQLRSYRTYATGRPDSPLPGPQFEAAIDAAQRSSPRAGGEVGFVDRAIKARSGGFETCRAVRLFNQLTAPVAAKSVEDTAFYRYSRILSRNDVGFDPRVHSMPVGAFHERISARSGRTPRTMLATATHDHKRGEDARARLAVLSEVPALWAAQVESWLLRKPKELDAGDAYTLLQTLFGAWPWPGSDTDATSGFADRIEQWCRKHLREAKLRSSWSSPDTAYEDRFTAFAGALIADPGFRREMDELVLHTAPAAVSNALVQLALRCTLPGIPDVFQGRERWDFSLVDPDNRRPVDYALRKASHDPSQPLLTELDHWFDGRLKQNALSRLLDLRRTVPGTFAAGTYAPVALTGPRAENVLAYSRTEGGQRIVVVAALCVAQPLCGTREIVAPSDWWGDTELAISDLAEGAWRDVLAGTEFSTTPRLVAGILDSLPVSVLCSR